MKKQHFLIIAGILAMCAVVLASCTEIKPESSISQGSSQDASSGDTSSVVSMVDGKYSSIASYVTSDEVQSDLEALKDAVAAYPVEVDVAGKENRMIYTYTAIQTLSDEQTAGITTILGGQAPLFEEAAAAVSLMVEVEEPVVTVRLIDQGGAELYTKDYAAESAPSISAGNQ